MRSGVGVVVVVQGESLHPHRSLWERDGFMGEEKQSGCGDGSSPAAESEQADEGASRRRRRDQEGRQQVSTLLLPATTYHAASRPQPPSCSFY